MTEDDYALFRELIENELPFNRFLGIRLVSLERGVCKLRIPYKTDLLGDTRRKALHGGVISTLVDTCGGFAIWSLCQLQDKISTIDLCVDYLKPAIECDLLAESRVRLLGNRVGNAATVVYSNAATPVIVAEGRSVYNIRRG